MHELLFRTQWALEDDDLAGYAARLGLDLDRFRDDLTRHAHAPRIRADLESGQRSGVRGTPTFFVNGTLYVDLDDSVDTLLSVIDRQRRRQRRRRPAPRGGQSRPRRARRMTVEDQQLLERINGLVAEEHRLLDAHGSGQPMSEEERAGWSSSR